MVDKDSALSVFDQMLRIDTQLPPKVIAVIGDVMTDVYVCGRLYSACQEDCPKFVEESRRSVPGGAANAARSIQHWLCRRVLIPESVPGPVKKRFLVDSQCVFRHDDDHIRYDTQIIRSQLMETLRKTRPDGVLISDYDKGLLTPDVILEIIRYCKRLGIVCVADAKRSPEVYEGALIKCNADYAGLQYRRLRVNEAVITRAAFPPYVYGRAVGVGLPAVPCVNRVGAGDCFAAHLTLGLACGLSVDSAAVVAHSAGRVYVQRPYNEPPHPGLIRADLLSGRACDPV